MGGSTQARRETYQGKVSRIYFRAVLEAERIKYAIRLPANQVLQGRISYLLKRPVGRPPNEVRRSMLISAIKPEAGRSRAG